MRKGSKAVRANAIDKRRPATVPLGVTVDDATRSRLANVKRQAGGGTPTLYVVADRSWLHCCLVVATCAEDAVEYCMLGGFPDWTLANTNTNRVARNVDAEPGVVTAFAINHPHLVQTRK